MNKVTAEIQLLTSQSWQKLKFQLHPWKQTRFRCIIAASVISLLIWLMMPLKGAGSRFMYETIIHNYSQELALEKKHQAFLCHFIEGRIGENIQDSPVTYKSLKANGCYR